MNIRPRSTGEILDDAWRLYLADAPTLLALSTLFVLPAALAILLLLTLPTAPAWAGPVLPAILAALVPVTGLGSAACQEAFRRRADGQALRWRDCLGDLPRRGLDHMAGRALVAGVLLVAFVVLRVPMLAIADPLATALSETAPELGFAVGFLSWAFVFAALAVIAAAAGAAGLHPLLAEGEQGLLSAWRSAMQEAQRQAAKASAMLLSRPPLWALAVLNFHLLTRAVLWIGDDLAGFDWAVPSAVLTLTNPAYATALVLLAGLLLAPLFEATNYLLHVDARARYEGLDLWYRVRKHFPVAAAVLLLVALASATTAAEPDRRAAVVQARQAIAAVREEVKAAEPYPGGERWLPRLRAAGERLDGGAGDRLRWYTQAAREFAAAKERQPALDALASLDQRLALLEDTLEAPSDGKSRQQVKELLPQHTAPERAKKTEKAVPEQKEAKRPVRRDEVGDDLPAARGSNGPSVVTPGTDIAVGPAGWFLLVGLLLAAVIVAIVRSRSRTPPTPTATTTHVGPSLESLLANGDRAAGEKLWQQADDLASAGRWLDALRTLYLAVLAQLHRADLIRYAQTRTNREYLEQLRPRTGVYRPFEGLTETFELKWYGEKSCQPDDYHGCRQLAEQVREGIRPR